jgi:DNA-binding beta-propeller fold protein YncE
MRCTPFPDRAPARDHGARLLRAARQTLLALLAFAAGGLTTAASAQPRDYFYYLGYQVIQVVDGQTDTIVADVPLKGFVREVDLSADRRYLYVATSRHIIHKLDLEGHRIVSTIDLNRDGWEYLMYGFALDADGKTAWGALMSRSTSRGEPVIGKPMVAQFDLADGRILRSVEVPWGVAHLVRVKGGILYAVGQDLFKIDTNSPEPRIVQTRPMFDKGMNILPFWEYPWENGDQMVAAYYTPTAMGMLRIDQTSGEVSEELFKGDPVMAYSVVLSPDRKTGYAVMDDINVLDMDKRVVTKSVPLEEGTSYGVNISSDGSKLYVGAGGATLSIYDTKSLRLLKVLHMASDGMDVRRLRR